MFWYLFPRHCSSNRFCSQQHNTMGSVMTVLAFLVIFFSLRFFQSNPVSEELSTPVSLESSGSDSSDSGQNDGIHDVFLGQRQSNSGLKYDYYQEKCPNAEMIIRSTMNQIFSQHKNAPAQLLRLLFHDCFIEGCDASVLLDDSNGNENHSIEKRAIPNLTLKGFNFIDKIKEELESACPGVVSCADILVLATRDGIVLAGGPFYPLITGRRDSNQSFFERAMAEIPRPDGNINETLRLFALRGFNDRETVALLGGHNIGKIGCEFIKPRLDNFLGTGQPDPTISSDFLNEMRLNCQDSNSSANDGAPSPMRSRRMRESTMGMSYYQGLSSSVSSGSEFDSHYYQILLKGRGLLFADQQLLANEKTAELVTEYALGDGKIFRMDFAQTMLKMSNLGVLTGSQGQVRFNCSLPVRST